MTELFRKYFVVFFYDEDIVVLWVCCINKIGSIRIRILYDYDKKALSL